MGFSANDSFGRHIPTLYLGHLRGFVFWRQMLQIGRQVEPATQQRTRCFADKDGMVAPAGLVLKRKNQCNIKKIIDNIKLRVVHVDWAEYFERLLAL